MLMRRASYFSVLLICVGVFACSGDDKTQGHPALQGAGPAVPKASGEPVVADAEQKADDVQPSVVMGDQPSQDTHPVEQFCQQCHALPNPANFTMETWMPALRMKFKYLEEQAVPMEGMPSKRSIVQYYGERAARTIDAPAYEPAIYGGFALQRSPLERKAEGSVAADMLVVSKKDGFGGDLLISDMLSGKIWAYSTVGEAPPNEIGQGIHLARMAVTDLDKDGRVDVLAGELGSFGAADHKRGGVLWFRQTSPGKFEKRVLVKDLGRVAGVSVGDLDGDGWPDVLVSEFGWLSTGSVRILWGAGRKAPGTVEILDHGRGAVSQDIADVDGDGRPDAVVLYAQEREEVLVYLNREGQRFQKKRIFAANDPLWGSTYVKTADIDGDGDVDVLVANGDNLDSPRVAKFQGVHLLKNEGGMSFTASQIGMLPGIQAFAVLDGDGDGDLDIFAASSLPATVERMVRRALPADKVLASSVLLRQDETGFKAETLTEDAPCYSAVAASSKPGGQTVVVGHFGLGWDLLGHQQTISSMQSSLSNCTEEYVAEVWRLGEKADPKKGVKRAPLPPAHRDENRSRVFRRVSALTRILESEPDNVDYMMALGISLGQLGQNQQALDTMKRAIKKQPKRIELKSNVATLLNDMGEAGEAEKLANEVLELRPNMVEAVNAKAIALARQNRLSEAIDMAKQATVIRPKFMPFWSNLIQLCMMERRYDEALMHVNRLLSQAPGHPAALAMQKQVMQAKELGARLGREPGIPMQRPPSNP